MKIIYDNKTDRRRDPRGAYVAPGALQRKVLSFEKWEKLPSDIELTRGECNQLYNILTYNLTSPTASVKRLIDKLEKQI